MTCCTKHNIGIILHKLNHISSNLHSKFKRKWLRENFVLKSLDPRAGFSTAEIVIHYAVTLIDTPTKLSNGELVIRGCIWIAGHVIMYLNVRRFKMVLAAIQKCFIHPSPWQHRLKLKKKLWLTKHFT